MSTAADCPLAAVLAERLHDESEDLVERWLERIMARVKLCADPAHDAVSHGLKGRRNPESVEIHPLGSNGGRGFR